MQLNGLAPGPIDTAWPVFGLQDDVRDALSQARAEDAPCALITLIAAQGPAPRGLGAQIVIMADGRAAGYVSGGCVEGALLDIARTQLRARASANRAAGPVRIAFGRGSPYTDVQLMCGTRIELLVETLAPDDPSIADILQARAARIALWRETSLSAPGPARTDAATLAEGPCCVVAGDHVRRRYDPAVRLIVVGRDPTALALTQLAAAMGLACALVRPLGPGEPPPITDARYLTAAPAAGLAEIGLDALTAVVATTHDLEEDHDALRAALSSEAFYVGALGSRRRRDDRIALLARDGLKAAAEARLKAPVGLAIGARTPHEIALAILADVIAEHRVRRP